MSGEGLLTAVSVVRPVPTTYEAMILTWTPQPLTREVARGLRAATRKSSGLDGHRFSFNDLKELWRAEEGDHIVLTHDADPVWQRWGTTPEGGWQLKSCHSSRQEAQRAAEQCETTLASPPEGIYILAWRPGGRTIRVQCRSNDPQIMREIFENLGYQTNVEAVG